MMQMVIGKEEATENGWIIMDMKFGETQRFGVEQGEPEACCGQQVPKKLRPRLKYCETENTFSK